MSPPKPLTLPVTHEEAVTQVDSHRHDDGAVAVSFSFASRRWRSGLNQGAGGAMLLGAGLFLLSQIGSTPALAVQLAILGTVLCIGSCVLLAKAVSSFAGRLEIDESGIAIYPLFVGYSIAWDELDRWDVALDMEGIPEPQSIRFWTQGSPCALFIPNGWLSDQDHVKVRRALQAFASGKAA